MVLWHSCSATFATHVYFIAVQLLFFATDNIIPGESTQALTFTYLFITHSSVLINNYGTSSMLYYINNSPVSSWH